VELGLEESRHGVLVLRLKPGDAVELAGTDGLLEAVVAESRKTPHPSLLVRILGPGKKPNPLKGPILLLPLIRPSRFDWAVEKSAELGASELIPFVSSRTRIQSVNLGAEKTSRWERISAEASKQSGRADFMKIRPPAEFSALLTQFAGRRGKVSLLLMDRHGMAFPGPAEGENECAVLIGPEGGFPDEERKAALEAGFLPFSLGSCLLRTETAALAALSLLAQRMQQPG
jgi:16S rRNA (uracil1498-N3)-methyltransferase